MIIDQAAITACFVVLDDRHEADFEWQHTNRYFSEVLMEVNLSFRLEPRPLTIAMIAREIPPLSSARNFEKIRFIGGLRESG
jgi:hypothetical protein